MTTPQPPMNAQTLNDEVRRAWDLKAAYWDERMAEGNLFHRYLVGPAIERLLDPQPGESILDVACGNGQIARRLAQLGAGVVAVDFSSEFLERARARTKEHVDRIEYRLLDATDRDQLVALGRHTFDAAVCSMALMDMVTIEPLFQCLPELLKPSGRFVFTIQHPCFNSNAVALVAEERGSGSPAISYFVKISEYLHVPPGTGAGMPGEPVPHWYFHRPLTDLLTIAFEAGLVMDGIEEPAFGENAQTGTALSWLNFADIPPVFAARLRVR